MPVITKGKDVSTEIPIDNNSTDKCAILPREGETCNFECGCESDNKCNKISLKCEKCFKGIGCKGGEEREANRTKTRLDSWFTGIKK